MCSLLLRILRFASVSFDIYLFIYLFFSWLIAKKPESAAALDSLSRVGAWDLSLLDTVPDSRRETRAGVPAWATRDRQALGPRSERRDSARPAQFRREGLSLWWCFRRFTYGNLVLFPCQKKKNKNNVRAGSRVETCKTSTNPPPFLFAIKHDKNKKKIKWRHGTRTSTSLAASFIANKITTSEDIPSRLIFGYFQLSS